MEKSLKASYQQDLNNMMSKVMTFTFQHKLKVDEHWIPQSFLVPFMILSSSLPIDHKTLKY